QLSYCDALARVLCLRASQTLGSPPLVVERAPISLADVGLIADHLVVLRDPLGAELDSAIRLVLVAQQLELELQLKVAVALGGAEELVSRDDRVERPADDRTVLDAPGL